MVPPGHLLLWQNGRTTLSQYWSLDEAFARPLRTSREEAVAKIRAALERAISRQQVSDVPLGVFLSGGTDSSAVVALTSTVTIQPPTTASLVFADERYSEEGARPLERAEVPVAICVDVICLGWLECDLARHLMLPSCPFRKAYGESKGIATQGGAKVGR
jgi:asparagine synthetase B (glutamine-hydrolysing)